MKHTASKHYMAVQTVLGTVTNVVLNAAMAALTTDNHKSDAASLHTLALVAAPQFFSGAFLGSLCPSLMVRWHYSRGDLFPPLEKRNPSVLKLIAVSASIGLICALLGPVLVGVALHLFFPGGLTWLTRVVFNGVLGGLLGVFTIPSALRLSFAGDTSS